MNLTVEFLILLWNRTFIAYQERFVAMFALFLHFVYVLLKSQQNDKKNLEISDITDFHMLWIKKKFLSYSIEVTLINTNNDIIHCT